MPSESGVRDQLAVERTILANERTVLAYIRTALGLVIVALALFTIASPSPPVVLGGVFLLLLGLAVAGHGVLKYYGRRAHYRRLRGDESRFIPPRE